MLSEYPARIRPFASSGAFLRRILIVMAGYNDVNTGGQTPAQVAATTATYVGLAVADGFEVWVGTAMLSGDAFSASIAAYNVLVRANALSWGARGIIDWEVASGLTPAGVTANPTNYVDEVHPNTTGYGKMATAAKNSIF